MDITHTVITTRTPITDLTPIMATMGGRHFIGTADTSIITATMVITTIITDVKVAQALEIQIQSELARKRFRASRIFRAKPAAGNAKRENALLYFFGLGDSGDFVAGLLAG